MTEFKPPSLARRLGASIYEFTLLFGIYFITGALVQVLFTLIGQSAPTWVIQLLIFGVLGWYFSHSWQKAGQTLAQRTWHIKVLNMTEQLPNAKQAWLRYLASYLGILPGLLMALTLLAQKPLNHENAGGFYIQMMLILLINWLALMGTSLMNPKRRALHELLSGTRSVYISVKN